MPTLFKKQLRCEDHSDSEQNEGSPSIELTQNKFAYQIEL